MVIENSIKNVMRKSTQFVMTRLNEEEEKPRTRLDFNQNLNVNKSIKMP